MSPRSPASRGGAAQPSYRELQGNPGELQAGHPRDAGGHHGGRGRYGGHQNKLNPQRVQGSFSI